MEPLINFILNQWQRKLAAILVATIIWFSVSYSITATKTLTHIPVRVINLPLHKTVQGLLPNGFLQKRVTISVTGTKDVVEQIVPGDLEILLDVANQPSEWIVQITKKNLVSLNPNLNLLPHISSVTNPEFVLKMSTILTEHILVTFHTTGSAPEGYEFLDIWPVTLTQTVSGPQDQVLDLKNKGLELSFNLNDITKEQLDAYRESLEDPHNNEVPFYIPEQWKKILISPLSPIPETLNAPEAYDLHLTFLKKEFLPIKGELPIRVFYPLKYGASLNPNNTPLKANAFVKYDHGIPVLKVPLSASGISKLFLDIVNDSLEIDIVAAPRSEREFLEWAIGFVDEKHLEDTYVGFMLSTIKPISDSLASERDQYLRKRFRSYIQNFALYTSPERPLILKTQLEDGKIDVQVPDIGSSDAR